MKELVEAIAKALVDNPDQVQVRAVEGEQVTVLELRVDPDRSGQGNRGGRPHGKIQHTHHPGRGGDEAPEAPLRWKSWNSDGGIRSGSTPMS